MENRLQRGKWLALRSVATLAGAFALYALANSPQEPVAMLIAAIVAGNVAFLVGRYSRRFRTGEPKKRIPAFVFLTIGLVGIAATFALANRPTTSSFSGEFCGSPLKARTSTDFMCAEDLKVARSLAITAAELGVGALTIWSRRRRQLDTRLVVVPVALSLVGVGAIPALATEHEFDKWDAFKPSPIAQPVANAVCAAASAWGRALTNSTQFAPQMGRGELDDRRQAAVQMTEAIEAGTRQLFTDLERAKVDYQGVPGATTFVGLIEEAYAPMKSSVLASSARARGMSVDSKQAFERDKDELAELFHDAGEGLTMPTIPDDPDAAVVAATMAATPSCFFPG